GWRYFPLGCILGALVVALGVGAVVRTEALRDERTEAARDTRRAADALALAVNGRLTLVRGLRAFLEEQWDKPDFPRRFDAFAARLIADVPGVRSAQYVVHDTIKHVYPLAGNEAAEGFDLRRHPEALETLRDLRKAESTTSVVLSGPIQLIQGGSGLIGRLAARNARGELIAVVALVLDLPPLLEEGGFPGSGPMLRALRDHAGHPIAGPDSLFAVPHVEVPFRLPDRTWVLAAAPQAGWLTASRTRVLRDQVAAFALALLVGLAIWQYRDRREAVRRARTETERRLAEERFSRLFQISPDGVVVTRVSDGTIIDVNDSFVALGGWRREELIGRTTLELGMWLSQADRDRLIELVRTQGQCVAEPVRVRRRDGMELDVEFSARILPGNAEPQLLSLTRDITERRALERKLAQAQRMEAIGRLAGGVAHDFNNILTAIVASAESARLAVPGDHPAGEESAEILRACGRASDLTRQLLTFARRQIVTPSRVDVNEIVEDARRFLERLIGADIRLVVGAADGLPPVLIDATQLQQVLLNLAVNARDAMPHGGVLTIETHPAPNGVRIEVRDSGVGIPLEHQPFIFEPFFTTKEPGKGTGLGLATVYGIVQQAGGSVEVRSLPGKGATFAIVLPGAQGRPDPEVTAVPEQAPARPARSGERILLAEDDPQVRQVTRRILKELGYNVFVATDGADALQVAGSLDDRVDLLMTDVVMPALSGVDLAQQLERRWPGLRVLYLSGYPEDYEALARALESGALLLPKPYTSAELAAAVRRALDLRRPSTSTD
ncbi:MAG TPA: ATP-binding protein, partial [Gemmatimonadales bacterium]|nr:ATP-binding protein [Gemmatimonadales bacterium]